MFIKSIVLDGFKSYAHRTEITGFDEQFNAITGLNGSGKSNILDAICFVLGISNLSHVRAASMQDLIYKSGQGGVNKATVSITFDNRNPAQSPPGFENLQEIIITRQIIMGGKNKYMINGVTATSKKVQDLFCSVQLNVNNPNFLIMQGKITKVLNMRAVEILAMIEEAAGTRMYEVKRQAARKTIEKKDAKLLEFKTVIKEEVAPRLEQFREERKQYLEYQRIERELEHMLGLYKIWQYFESKRKLSKAESALEKGQEKVTAIETKIDNNKKLLEKLDKEIESLTNNAESSVKEELRKTEEHLKEKEKQEAKLNSQLQSIRHNVTNKEKKKKQLEASVTDHEKALNGKEEELVQVQALFETLKETERKDSEALALSEKKYEALCAGMEVNEAGEAETLAEQLMSAKKDASEARTECQKASIQLTSCESQLKEKQKEMGVGSSDHEKDQENLHRTEKEIKTLEKNLSKLNFSEEKMQQLYDRKRNVTHEVRVLKERIDNFEAHKPYTNFRYRDPETNFNRNSVKGVACRLIKTKENIYNTALETAAGGRLYNVVVDTDITSKKLLQRGNLQHRTTFIPLNKITPHKMHPNCIKLAQELVGKENCQPALSLIDYDNRLSIAMEFIFGNVFICKDINVAKRVTFHDKIQKRCVTLDGDSVDPSGTLSGGSAPKGGSVLTQLQQILQLEEQLKVKEEELAELEKEIRQMSGGQEEYNVIKQRLDLLTHERNLITQRLLNTTFSRRQEEVNGLKQRIEELKDMLRTYKEKEAQSVEKARELEHKMKDATGYRTQRLKEAETEIKKLKQKSDKSKKEWEQREQDYGTLTLEISELKKMIENTKIEIKTVEEEIEKLQKELEEATGTANKMKETVSALKNDVNKAKSAIRENDKEARQKMTKKNHLIEQNGELELEIKKCTHEIKELTDACKSSKTKEQEYAKLIKNNSNHLQKGEEMSQEEGRELEHKIKVAQEKKHKLSRSMNVQAQNMFEYEEKKFNELKRKENIVETDKKKILGVIADLDEKKRVSLQLAYEQVSKDFGSIFGTLLMGANAKLAPPPGKTILDGLEIKVSLGGVWKESLTELSGGQRSLAALSLILAMLLFKPAPLYILDEVDAALDLSHTQNIGTMLKRHFKKSQFIIVSLKDGMFSNANVLFRTKFVDGASAIDRAVNQNK